MRPLYGWLTDRRAREENARLGDRVGQLLSQDNSSHAQYEFSSRAAVGLAGSGPGNVGKIGEIIVAISGTAVWAHAELAQQARQLGMPASLAAAYRSDGAAIFKYLRGAFVLAIVNDHVGEVVLAVDRMGVGSIIYACPANGVVFASTADAVLAHPDVSREINSQGLYNYVYFHVVPGPGTVYQGLSRLEPGHCAFSRTGGSNYRLTGSPTIRRLIRNLCGA